MKNKFEKYRTPKIKEHVLESAYFFADKYKEKIDIEYYEPWERYMNEVNRKLNEFSKELEDQIKYYCSIKGISISPRSLKRNLELIYCNGENVHILYDNLNKIPVLYINYNTHCFTELY